MLNLLRNAANLEKLSAGLVDSRDTELLRELTSSLGTGALVYVDDFTGTGKQFLRNRRNAAEYLIGNFSEFFLVACACSEAEEKIQREGVVCRSIIAHKRSERPLHERSNLLPQETKSSLQAECFKIHPKEGLGFKKLATNVVLYGNAPNTTPLLLRGSLQQKPRLGVLPRFDELPFPEEVQLDIGE